MFLKPVMFIILALKMTYQLNITKNQFDSIDFSEASAFMPKLGTYVELNCWGITLLTSQRWGKPLKLPGIDFNDDAYIAGLAKVIFREIVGGEIKVTLYDKPVTLQKRWRFKQDDSIFVYELDCASKWPAGACYLALASKGQALLKFEISDCIPARQFVLNPQKYSQLGWKKAEQKRSHIEYEVESV
jgi:hypothetical protein